MTYPLGRQTRASSGIHRHGLGTCSSTWAEKTTSNDSASTGNDVRFSHLVVDSAPFQCFGCDVRCLPLETRDRERRRHPVGSDLQHRAVRKVVSCVRVKQQSSIEMHSPERTFAELTDSHRTTSARPVRERSCRGSKRAPRSFSSPVDPSLAHRLARRRSRARRPDMPAATTISAAIVFESHPAPEDGMLATGSRGPASRSSEGSPKCSA